MVRPPVPDLGPVGARLAEDRVAEEDLLDVLAEEGRALDRRDAAVARLGHLQAQRLLLGLVGLRLGDVADLGHALQHDVAPPGGLRLVVDRVVAARGLDDAGQQGRLRQAQVLGVLGEVALGGGLDAVGLLTEESDVEVVLEDLLLAQFLLDLDRVLQFLDLAAEGLLGGLGDLRRVVAGLLHEDVLHILLGERGGALGDAALLRVLVQGAQHALEVDRAVLVEARVLDGDDRLLHVRRDVLQRHHRAVAGVDLGDLPALGVQDRGALAERRTLEIGRDVVEPPLDRALGRQAQCTGRGQRDTGQHHSREHTDTEELGGLLRWRQTTARALLWHEGSLRSHSPDTRICLGLSCSQLSQQCGHVSPCVPTCGGRERFQVPSAFFRCGGKSGGEAARPASPGRVRYVLEFASCATWCPLWCTGKCRSGGNVAHVGRSLPPG